MPEPHQVNSNKPVDRRTRAGRWRFGVVGGLLLAAAVAGVWPRFSSPQPWFAVAPLRRINVLPGVRRVRRMELPNGVLQDWNVLLVTLDTTRADHLGCYGDPDAGTPVLDRLAERSAVFSVALAVSPATLSAHASIMTGLYPFTHGARANGLFRLAPGFQTLAETFRDAGYRTGAAVSTFVLEARYGLNQGFEFYEDQVNGTSPTTGHRLAAETNRHAQSWLRDHAPERFFFWAHYFDPHQPHRPPAPYDKLFVADPYAGEIAYMDEQIGALLETVRTAGALDRTLVVVVGDHGEGLGQHDEFTHGTMLYESTVRIPLMFHARGRIEGPMVVTTPASQADVAPTILALTGLPPMSGTDGQNLLGSAATGERVFMLEALEGKAGFGWAPLLGVRTERYKYVLAPTEELYDLLQDPNEEANILATQPVLVDRLRSLMKGFFGSDLLRATTTAANVSVDAEALAKLNALGYLRTSADLADVDRPAPDPKDVTRAYGESGMVMAAYRADGDLSAAVSRLEALGERDPDNFFVYERIGNLYFENGDYANALKQYRRSLEARPGSARCHVRVAKMLALLDRSEEAIPLYRRAAELSRAYFEPRYQLAHLFEQTGRFRRAARFAKEALDINPAHVGAMLLLGRALDRTGRGAEAIARARRWVAAHPDSVPGRGALARLLEKHGRFGEAIETLRTGLQRNPDAWALALNLASLLTNCPDPSLRDRDEALRLARHVCDLKERKDPTTLANVGAIHAAFGEYADAATMLEEAIAAAEALGRPQEVRQLTARLESVRSRARDVATPSEPDASSEVDDPGR